jgi:PAS domain S-box-containing protein
MNAEPDRGDTDAALRRSEERYRSLVSATAQVVWVTDADGRVVEHTEPGAPDPAGVRSRASGDGWLETVHPEDRERVRGAWLSSVRSRVPCSIEYRWRSSESGPEGEWRHVAARGVPVFEPDGVTVREWVGTTTDIHAERAAAAALRDSEERLRLALSAARQRTWDVDLRTGRGRLSGEFGLPSADPTDASIEFALEEAFFTVHPDDAPRVRAEFDAAVRGEGEFDTSYRVLSPRAPGGVLWLATCGVVMRAEDGTPLRFLGVARDATRDKEAEAEREAMVAQQRAFFKQVMASVTEGRLRLCDSEAELPAPLPPLREVPGGGRAPLVERTQLGPVRDLVRRAAAECGLAPERAQDLLTGASEAAMNAVVHGGGGWAEVRCADETVQVWVRDSGRGIDLSRLPEATLWRGKSTAGTLGHGFWLMLQACDRVYLLTGPQGTTVVVEQDRTPPQAPWLRGTTAAVRWEQQAQAQE